MRLYSDAIQSFKNQTFSTQIWLALLSFKRFLVAEATALPKSILEVLSQTWKGTLRILDIEGSRHVEDDSVDLIKTCNKLMKINFFSLVSV